MFTSKISGRKILKPIFGLKHRNAVNFSVFGTWKASSCVAVVFLLKLSENWTFFSKDLPKTLQFCHLFFFRPPEVFLLFKNELFWAAYVFGGGGYQSPHFRQHCTKLFFLVENALFQVLLGWQHRMLKMFLCPCPHHQCFTTSSFPLGYNSHIDFGWT